MLAYNMNITKQGNGLPEWEHINSKASLWYWEQNVASLVLPHWFCGAEEKTREGGSAALLPHRQLVFWDLSLPQQLWNCPHCYGFIGVSIGWTDISECFKCGLSDADNEPFCSRWSNVCGEPVCLWTRPFYVQKRRDEGFDEEEKR